MLLKVALNEAYSPSSLFLLPSSIIPLPYMSVGSVGKIDIRYNSMTSTTQPKLTDAETMEMLIAFYSEALDFLNVPIEERAEVKMGVSFNGADGKAKIISIDCARRKILVFLPMLRLFILASNNNTGDAPSLFRFHGYKLARIWQQYLTTGEPREFEHDKDSCDFAMALEIVKGLPQIDYPSEDMAINAFGFNPFDRKAAIWMLREEFGIDCRERQALTIQKEKRTVISLTEQAANKYVIHLNELFQASINQSLPHITDGQLGSRCNPFQNVDEAAAYILKLEKDRLNNDPYRQEIDHEQYFYDSQHGVFRIPWASDNVSYYPLKGASGSSFVVNQLSQRPGHYNEIPRFSIKPSLAHNKFLFRGQSKFYDNCVPSLFRNKDNVRQHQYVDEVIQINEFEVLLRQHPLVKLFERGFYLLHDFFRFRVDYTGLSQHYYTHTPLLDLTSDIEVAKFFAVTWLDMNNDCYEKYTGNELGVLYYYDLEPDAFKFRKGRKYLVETIGKQPFMRSGNQSGFLICLDDTMDFNTLPEVRYVFFRHDNDITNRIFADSENGNKYMPHEMLRTHWYKRMSNEKAMKEISTEALKLNFENNKDVSHKSIIKKLKSKGFHISPKNIPYFTKEELDIYYSGALDFWKEFCSNVHIYSPEGALLHKHLENLPNDPRYRWAFYNPN